MAMMSWKEGNVLPPRVTKISQFSVRATSRKRMGWIAPKFWMIPPLGRKSVVVSDSDGSQISEESKEDDELGTDGLVEDDHRSDEVDLQMQAKGDTVLDVSLHALENLASSLDGEDDGGQTGGEEDDISGSLGSLGGTFNSNTAVRLLKRRGVVDTVSGHSSQVTTLLQHLYDLVLVFGEDFGETIGALDEIVLGSTGKTTGDEPGRVVDLGAESKHLAGLLGDGNSVTTVELLAVKARRWSVARLTSTS
jgi:hypothetical protein